MNLPPKKQANNKKGSRAIDSYMRACNFFFEFDGRSFSSELLKRKAYSFFFLAEPTPSWTPKIDMPKVWASKLTKTNLASGMERD